LEYNTSWNRKSESVDTKATIIVEPYYRDNTKWVAFIMYGTEFPAWLIAKPGSAFLSKEGQFNAANDDPNALYGSRREAISRLKSGFIVSGQRRANGRGLNSVSFSISGIKQCL
jgi:hypothetical protein